MTMHCLSGARATVRPCRPAKGVRAAASKKSVGVMASGLAAAVLLTAGSAQAGLFDGAKNTEGLGGGQTSEAAAQGGGGPTSGSGDAPNSAGADVVGSGKPYGGESDRPFGKDGIVGEMLGGGAGTASVGNQNPTTSTETPRGGK